MYNLLTNLVKASFWREYGDMPIKPSTGSPRHDF